MYEYRPTLIGFLAQGLIGRFGDYVVLDYRAREIYSIVQWISFSMMTTTTQMPS
jgi:hypothetical protein